MVIDMKKIFAATAALFALAACNKNLPVMQPVTELTATVENGLAKSHLDGNGVLWDANDEISVFALTGGVYANEKFSTADEGASAIFKGPGIDVDENLYALYPYDADAQYSAVNGFKVNADYASQKVVNGTFDKRINLAVGKYAGEKKVSFRNAGALLKFSLTQERADTVRRIELKTADGTPIAFTGEVQVAWNDGSPALSIAADAAKSDIIKLSPAAGAFATGDTYYVWVLPGEYKGISITLVSSTGMTAVKTGSSTLTIARNQIVDLGEVGGLTYKEKEAERKTLHFDFSGDPLEGWPTADKWQNGPGDTTCVYKLDGADYEFLLTECGNASQARVAWVTSKGGLVMFASWRYIGLPALDGFRLVKMSGVSCLTNSTSRKAGIVTAVAPTNEGMTIDTAHTFVPGGESITWAQQGGTYSYNLEDTKPNTVYYFMCTGGGIGASSIDLTYEKAE